jgi:hypothetical protein
MDAADEPLCGFSTRMKRDTTGIIFWSDVFLHTNETNGEEFKTGRMGNYFRMVQKEVQNTLKN